MARNVFAVLAILVLAARGVAGQPGQPRPNIVFILADDHTTQAIGCYGGQLMETPNIDRIAAQGVRFQRAFVTESICGPSRAAMLTGKYGHVTGAMGWAPYDRRHRTFPEYLQQSGYQTALVGKYHLGDDPPGFDYFDIFPGQGRHLDPELVSKQGKRVVKGHSSDIITDLALGWLDGTAKDRPFLLCLHDKSTHLPWQPAPRFHSLFSGEQKAEPATLFDDFRFRADVMGTTICRIDGINRWQQSIWGAPPNGLDGAATCQWLYQQYIKHYLRCAAGLDENVGRLLDGLEHRGLADNTVIIYASDQGFLLGEHGLFDKRWMHEECLRTPVIIRPAQPVRGGRVEDAMVLNIDLAPTLLDLAGLAVPADIQGRSLRPLLEGRRPSDWRRSIYYRYYAEELGIPPQYGVRTERHKLVHYQGRVGVGFGSQGVEPAGWQDVDAWELFDLKRDPAELRNLYAEVAAKPVVSELKAELARLQKELGDSPAH